MTSFLLVAICWVFTTQKNPKTLKSNLRAALTNVERYRRCLYHLTPTKQRQNATEGVCIILHLQNTIELEPNILFLEYVGYCLQAKDGLLSLA